MRLEVQHPADQNMLQQLLPLAETVYYLHESGQHYTTELNQISRLLGRIVGKMDVLGAFGSISANEFATRLAIDWDSIPKDLSDSELLELFDAICEVRGGEATLEYWIQCLAINTGDDRVSDLIFWPDQYFGVDYDGQELTSAEMLEVTLRNRTKDHI
jgi:hypothetical protein